MKCSGKKIKQKPFADEFEVNRTRCIIQCREESEMCEMVLAEMATMATYAMQFDGWSLTRARIETNSYENLCFDFVPKKNIG